MATGAAWMVLMRLFVRSIGLISTVVLARLLVPADFGLVALAVSIVFLIEVLGDFGFEWVLIRYQGQERSLYDTAWTLGLLKACLLATILLVAAKPLSVLFDAPQVDGILLVLALNAVVMDARNIGIVEFRKQLDFRMEFAIQAIKKLAAFVATLALAFLWRDYWALVTGIVVGNIAFLVASFVLHPYRPRFDLSRWRELIDFSMWVMLNGVVGALAGRLPALVLGKLVGARDLGFYSIGKEVADLPTTELVWPIATALYPGYAKFATEPQTLRRMYLASYEIIFLIGAPVGIGMALAAPWFVPLLLGEQWGAAVHVAQVLSVAGVVRVISTGAGSMYLALGKPRLQFIVSLIALVISVPAIVLLTRAYGVNGAVYALFITYAAATLMHIGVVSWLIGISWHYPFTRAWRSMLAVGAMAATVTVLPFDATAVTALMERTAQLAAIATLGAVTYVSVHGLLWLGCGRPEGAEARCLAALATMFGKLQFGGRAK